MTPYEVRLVQLIERLEATLEEVRAHLKRHQEEAAAGPAEAVEAFADELFRERDA